MDEGKRVPSGHAAEPLAIPVPAVGHWMLEIHNHIGQRRTKIAITNHDIGDPEANPPEQKRAARVSVEIPLDCKPTFTSKDHYCVSWIIGTIVP
jgi:hypothetical protein